MNHISDEMAANFKDGPVLKSSCKIEVANAVMHILNSVGEDTRACQEVCVNSLNPRIEWASCRRT